VAFDIGEGRPAGLVSLQVAGPLGAQAQQALGLGVEGAADEIEVQAVLDGLRLRTLLNVIRGPPVPPSPGSRITRSDVESSATCRPRTSAQNLATAGASAQSIAIATSELLISAFPFTNGRRLCGRPEGLARIARGLTCRKEGGRDPAPFPPAPGSDGGPAAVSGDDRAGDIAGLRGGEEGDHGGDLAGLGGPGQQSRGAECLDAGGGGSVGQDRPGSDGIDRIPEGLNSAAQERVIAARVALVAL
jgi:hypothetical protein